MAGIEHGMTGNSCEDDKQEECEFTAEHNTFLGEISQFCIATFALGHLRQLAIDKYYPRSLTEDIIELLNDCSTAYTTAERNMDKIRLIISDFPDTLNLVLLGTEVNVEVVTNDALEKLVKKNVSIEKICQDTGSKFSSINDKMKELLEENVRKMGAVQSGHIDQYISEEKEFQAKHERSPSIKTPINLTRIDKEKIQGTLKKGLIALTRVIEMWAQLERFFSQISGMVSVTYADVIGFKTKATNMLDYQSDFNRALMYNYAKNATQSSMAIHSLSSMYVDVSEKCITPRLITLLEDTAPEEGQSVPSFVAGLEFECAETVLKIERMTVGQRQVYRQQVKRELAKMEAIRRNWPRKPLEQHGMMIKPVIQEGLDVDPDDY